MTYPRIGRSASRTVTRAVEALDSATPSPSATLLAVCPISPAIVDANLSAARDSDAPAIFTATLNQVDTDLGYTGWSPEAFVQFTTKRQQTIAPSTSVVCCLDHGGPWKKDLHVSEGWEFERAWAATKQSIAASIRAGYVWLHLDATVDMARSGGLPPELIAERTASLVAFAEAERRNAGAPTIHYEAGIEEAGQRADVARDLDSFLTSLNAHLANRNLPPPSFTVCDLGTRLDASTFDRALAKTVVAVAARHGTLVKAHYSDDLKAPEIYPQLGMGAANVGPGLAARELDALASLQEACAGHGHLVDFVETVFAALDSSDRWRKWIDCSVSLKTLRDAPRDTRQRLLRTGARYVLNLAEVVHARERLRSVVGDCLGADLEVLVRDNLKVELERLYRNLGLTNFNRRIG